MFDFLKKRISDFKERIGEKIKKKAEDSPPVPEEAAPEAAEVVQELPARAAKKPRAPEPEAKPEAKPPAKPEEKPVVAEKAAPEKAGEKPAKKPVEGRAEAGKPEAEARHEPEAEAEEKEAVAVPEAPPEKPEAKPEAKPERPEKPAEKRELKAKVSLKTKLMGVVSRTIKISEADLHDLLSELELALLESDVEQGAALEIVSNLSRELEGKEIRKSEDISEFLKKEIRDSLAKVMDVQPIDLFAEAEGKKPYIILFLGPNGAGKTTTMAKLTSLFAKHGKKTIWAASDTFRAASIEQLEEHARRINVRVVKHGYGADPAAVAYDAIEAARAHNIDVVMIDSAGRQETNKNLMEELRKIARVAKPHLKLYIGESYAGQSLLTQAEEFDKNLEIDAFVLTKADADAKGGTAISLLYRLKKPIAFIGTGQEYTDLIPFSPSFILDRIV
jgi:fused signal recognition particle receptor